jgi:hypothetical protein
MKQTFIISVLAMVVAGGVFGQADKTWYNSYAEGIDQKYYFNAGIGAGPTGGYESGILPLAASLDFKLSVDKPITVGGIINFSQWKYTVSMPAGTEGRPPKVTYKDYDIKWNNLGLGLRGMWHFNFKRNLDTYAGVTLGYVFQTFDGGELESSEYKGLSFFLFGVNVGLRYFFTETVGAYLELGYSGLQFVSAGLSIKR